VLFYMLCNIFFKVSIVSKFLMAIYLLLLLHFFTKTTVFVFISVIYF